MPTARAIVDLEFNVCKLSTLIANKDPEAKRVLDLILQDAYVVKNGLYGHLDAYGSDRCKSTTTVYAHVKT